MKQKIYQIDAFTDKVFAGNPAAVCPLDEWLSDDLLQNIAMENNLAETAFYVKQNDRYEIRWFTPTVEVDLCGHATLAAAFVLFNYEKHISDVIQFYSQKSGMLEVTKKGDMLTMNFPVDIFQEIPISTNLLTTFNIEPKIVLKGKTDYVFVFEAESDIRNIKPDLSRIAKLGGRGTIITAKGNKEDFVSRFFAPQSGIDEDPVTGSAHTTLVPFWSKLLKKDKLTATQLSKRGGYLECKHLGDRVEISGKARLYMLGYIYLH